MRTGAKKCSRNKEALRECCEGVRRREAKLQEIALLVFGERENTVEA